MIDNIINRDAAVEFKKRLELQYIIALLGARQVGKSTLLRQVLPPEQTVHVNFDSSEVRDRVLAEESYLLKLLEEHRGGPLARDGGRIFLCIDEAQKLPESFEIIKQLHDAYAPALKIILSGSSSLLIKKHAAETLAGRIRFLHLHPFSLGEACRFEGLKKDGEDTSEFFEALISGTLTERQVMEIALSKRHLARRFREHLGLWCRWGLMPPRFHLVGESEWILLLRDYVDTYIEKDMRATERIGSLGDYKKLVRLMGAAIGNLVNYSKIAAAVGVHRQTVKEYLQILDESLLGFRLPVYSESLHRQMTKADKSFLLDNGLAYYFMDLKSPEVLEASGRIGALYENMIIAEFRKRASLLSAPLNLSYWRLAGNNPPEVDLVAQYRGTVIPIEIKMKSRIDAADLRGLKAFLASYGGRKNIRIPFGAIIYQGDAAFIREHSIHCLPDFLFT